MSRGILLLLSSAISFALSTVFVKLVTSSSDIHALELTFFRFILGFLVVCCYLAVTRKSLRPRKARYIIMRSIFNTVAVVFFFVGIQHSTVSKVNLLNMTYPVFVFLLSPIINRERAPKLYYLYLIFTLAGIYLIVSPDALSLPLSGVNRGDLFGLLSGVVAGFAITTLRQARKYDDSSLILFYLMAFGSVATFFLMLPFFIIPTGLVLFYSILVSLTSVVGQVCLTVGYRHIDATAGSLVSSSRIVFAVILGASIFADPITQGIVIGGLLIMVSLIGVSGIAGKWTGKSK